MPERIQPIAVHSLNLSCCILSSSSASSSARTACARAQAVSLRSAMRRPRLRSREAFACAGSVSSLLASVRALLLPVLRVASGSLSSSQFRVQLRQTSASSRVPVCRALLCASTAASCVLECAAVALTAEREFSTLRTASSMPCWMRCSGVICAAASARRRQSRITRGRSTDRSRLRSVTLRLTSTSCRALDSALACDLHPEKTRVMVCLSWPRFFFSLMPSITAVAASFDFCRWSPPCSIWTDPRCRSIVSRFMKQHQASK
mmetsp:Transcript_16353/g.49201  ORF Transcript_16353/g.49201 Transcript_16353/m.49201 type:complete len:262 (+) Transcript_16353:233-1018(+)